MFYLMEIYIKIRKQSKIRNTLKKFTKTYAYILFVHILTTQLNENFTIYKIKIFKLFS